MVKFKDFLRCILWGLFFSFFPTMIRCSRVKTYEIKSLMGEPNYRSVNLTWEVEKITSPSSASSSSRRVQHSIRIKDGKFPKIFTIFYCELQSFGPHRCKSKLIEDNSIKEEDDLIRRYSTIIDNLRMATKYSFHIKPQTKKKIPKINGRSDNRDNEINSENVLNNRETIVVPTKGFSAEATKCLPHVSEIEVQTGPNFGGKIVVDGGNCGIQGNPKDSADKYIMRIDHEKCGSIVKPESNTVETFITVQENLGIFTHSTRRFVVVCTFQSGIQTVRASFMVPGKDGSAAPMTTNFNETDEYGSDRTGRERNFRMVDKTALIFKEPSYIEEEKFKSFEDDVENSVAVIENMEVSLKSENSISSVPISDISKENISLPLNSGRTSRHAKFTFSSDYENLPTVEMFGSKVNLDTSYTGVIIAVSLSIIMIGMFIYVVQREIRRLKAFKSEIPKQQIVIKQ